MRRRAGRRSGAHRAPLLSDKSSPWIRGSRRRDTGVDTAVDIFGAAMADAEGGGGRTWGGESRASGAARALRNTEVPAKVQVQKQRMTYASVGGGE
jgi:hypothetical protein